MATAMAASDSNSDSDSENVTVDVGADPPVDDSICIVCRTSTYIGQTINCETCALWFHFGCVGVKPGDDVVEREDVPYFCPDCVGSHTPAAVPPIAPAPTKPRNQKRAAAATPNSARNRRHPKNAKSQPLTAAKSLGTPKKRVSQQVPPPVAAVPPLASPPIKLKISFGPKTASSALPSISNAWTSLTSSSTPPSSGSPGRRRVSVSSENQAGTSTDDESGRKRRRRKSQDEEEKWLDAVEAGNMTAVDPELKSIKDPKLMTARQRAMVEKQKLAVNEPEDALSPAPLAEAGHMALDYGYKKKELDTEESLQLKAIKSQKRKVIEMEKRENDKKKTMDRLLKKKDSKAAARQTKSVKSVHRESPKFSYTINHSGRFVSVPPHTPFPFEAQGPREPPPVVLCAIPSCGAPKKYQCAQSGKPLCSLPCYKANQLLIQAQS